MLAKATVGRGFLEHPYFYIDAASAMREACGAPVCAIRGAERYLLDTHMNLSEAFGDPLVVESVQFFEDGETIALDANPEFSLKAIHVPGHTTDSTMFYSADAGIAFVGDTVFRGGVGTWRYSGGNRCDLIRSLRDKILSLPDGTMLYPGHTPETNGCKLPWASGA